MEPKRGAIARCGMGRLGIILSFRPQRIQYSGGEWADVWTGVHIETETQKPVLWSSKKPEVIGYVSLDILDLLALPDETSKMN